MTAKCRSFNIIKFSSHAPLKAPGIGTKLARENIGCSRERLFTGCDIVSLKIEQWSPSRQTKVALPALLQKPRKVGYGGEKFQNTGAITLSDNDDIRQPGLGAVDHF